MRKTFVQLLLFLNVLLVIRTTELIEDCPSKCRCRYSRRADWKKTVDCSRIKLTSVPSFKNPSNVTYLILKDNWIQTITSSDFNGFSSLVRLDISKNPLKQVPTLALNDLPKLEWLKVQTEKLEADSFTGLNSLKSLYIYGSKAIRSIDRAMLEPVQLTLVYLRVQDTSIEHFPDVAGFKLLERLDLCDNQLKTFSVNESLSLKYVDLSNNNLKALSLSNMKNLHNLMVSHNKLETITLANCRELWVLDFSYNRLVELHEGMLEPMEHLYMLLLANNLLEKVNITDCSQLKNIDLNFNHRLTNLKLGSKSSCFIYSLSIVQSNLTKLHVTDNIIIQNLNISFNCQLVDFEMSQQDYNQYYSVDWSSSCMSYLHSDDVVGKYFRNRVYLHNNTLERVYTVNSIKYMDLSMNQLTSIWFNTKRDTDYGSIDLSYNRISTLHTSWYDEESSMERRDKYMRLVSLSLRHNNMMSFPNLTKVTGDTDVVIEELDLSYNNLISLNESVSKLMSRPASLRILNISYNSLRGVKTSVFDRSLVGLEKLDLSHNQLSDSFTKWSIYGLRKLKNLNLNSNSIKKIFTNHSQYHQNLVTLDLRNNQLTKIPLIDFKKWNKLTHLDLRMNSITEIPMEMLQQINSFYGDPKHHTLSLDLLLSNVTHGEPIRHTDILLSDNPLRCNCTLVLALDLDLLKPNDTCYGTINAGNSISIFRVNSLKNLISRSGHVPCNFCQFNVCHNRGECFPDYESGFKCKCYNGYIGDRCDGIDCLNSGRCHRCYGYPDYCQNGGECIRYAGNFRRKQCRCPDHYTGEVCQHHVTKLCTTQQLRKLQSPCQNGGICQVESLGKISCACSGDFEGEFCELEKLSGCNGAFCNQHGVCVLNEASGNQKCICDKEWGGRNCNVHDASHLRKSAVRVSLPNIGNIVLAVMLLLTMVALVFVICRYKTKRSKIPIVHYRLHENLDDQ